MIRFLDGWQLRCGCTYNAGQWFACFSHNEYCEVCRMPMLRGSQGICLDCLDAKTEKAFVFACDAA